MKPYLHGKVRLLAPHEKCDTCDGTGDAGCPYCRTHSGDHTCEDAPCAACGGIGKHPDVSALLAKLREGT